MPELTTEQGALLALIRSLNARLGAIVDLDAEAVKRGAPTKANAERRRLIEQMEAIIGRLEAMHA